MLKSKCPPLIHLLLLTFLVCVFASVAWAGGKGTVGGKVIDPLGAAVPSADVSLLQDGNVIANTKTDQEGSFTFSAVDAGQYLVRVQAPGFEQQETTPVNLAPGRTADLQVLLHVGTLRQQFVVSDTGTPLPESQVGASVTILDQSELDAFNKLDLVDAFRQVPGLAVVQTGQRGGTTSVFARGAASNFNKLLIDGVPANDIGGMFDFANLAATGASEVEVYRGANSVLYGPDALGSVIQVTTRRGSSSVPEFTYSADGGNFNTLHQDASLGGAFHQFDYFADFMGLQTQNSLPNSSFHNSTVSGNFGWQANQSTDVRFTIRHTATGLGIPNALAVYGIPDDAFQREQDTYMGIKVQNQTTSQWLNSLQLSSMDLHYNYDEPAPAGTPFEGNYVGNPINLCGANGFCSSGRAILDYGGSYPSLDNSHTAVQTLYGLSSYAIKSDLSASAGIRYDHESGYTNYAGSLSPATRNNFDYFMEAHGSLGHRAFVTAGLGLADNAVYGFAATPRVSAAYYVRRPTSGSFFNGTKLRFNYGTGIDEPSIYNQGSSLFNLLSTLPGGSGPGLISQYHVSPIGPERSRNFDWGIEQSLWGGRARLGITGFHESFYNLIAFVDKSLLPELGVPAPIASALPFGAAVNSDSYHSLGTEVEIEAKVSRNFRVNANYTYTHAVVTQSFASSAQVPSFNPNFPNIPIGAYSPLIDGRPFGVPRNSGSMALIYSQRRFGMSATGNFTSRSDDSTFLSDEYYGNTLLLPNRNLLNAYQLIDCSGWFEAHHGVTLYTSIGNVLDEHYQGAFGYPALPFNFRSGIKFTIGGEGWKRK